MVNVVQVWCHIVRLAAHNNGANLDQQQLTKNDVPVIVEKSINYIYAYGIVLLVFLHKLFYYGVFFRYLVL